MPRIVPTIEELISTDIKRDGLWIVFNTAYNRVAGLKQSPDEIPELQDSEEIGRFGWLDQAYTDQQARNEFVAFMEKQLPEVKLIDVFDYVPTNYLQWPYLGSIAIEVEIGSPQYEVVCQRYGDPFASADESRINQMLWIMPFDEAQKIHSQRCELLED